MAVEYVKGSDLPDLAITWRTAANAIVDFSVAHTYEVKVGLLGAAASFTKTTGITGAATSPNITIQWATTSELNDLAPGTYTLQIKATRTSDSRNRYLQVRIRILSAVT